MTSESFDPPVTAEIPRRDAQNRLPQGTDPDLLEEAYWKRSLLDQSRPERSLHANRKGLKQSSSDLVLLAFRMPQMVGSTLTREIEQLNPGIPILLFSGRTRLPAEELTYANAYVGNGVTLDDLLTQLRVLIDPKTERRTAEVSDRKSESKHGESSGRHL